ncbi:peptidoglycan editing factor PgeF [Marinomonas sp. 15G1-11]|uniref:Purine nucleoside phosphorylase n=1 Tax=Marinomonas phaeophyticola TaxID=3004091 RepID=A0ABT4JQG7_9GAMM|nr:peptidoglycan editing factor PgeF [Marinomonas sp. 15G1-11]MCZ2720598.1 peptidoglycan editing factor PgeF [Marinomonas sp. 15G1-11]
MSDNLSTKLHVIHPNWPAPKNVRAYSSTRIGGVSDNEYKGLNLGAHVGDDFYRVASNRRLFQQHTDMPNTLVWLNQIHGTKVLELPLLQDENLDNKADASITYKENQVCAILTADCLPILLTNDDGTQVAALHAGWRGLCDGVIEQTVGKFEEAENVMAWLGPAIGAMSFEVGGEVRAAFLERDSKAVEAFTALGEDKWLGDLYLLARQRLSLMGVNQIYGGDHCTFTERDKFYSYRRDGITGRMASVIWFE